MLAIMILRAVQEGLNAGLGVAPSASIKRLLLGPDDGLGVGIRIQVLAELLPREGMQLLDAGDGDVVEAVVGAVLDEGSIDLAGAEDQAVDLVVRLDGTRLVGRVGDDPAEGGLADELLDVRAGDRVAQEGLGEEEDQGCTS